MVLTAEPWRWYDSHAEEFEARTAHSLMEHLYEPFLSRLLPGARILDAGCGVGRDAAAFEARGYAVTAFDASSEMVRIATARLGRPVIQMRFADISWDAEFEGVWACASLLHVPPGQLPEVFSLLSRALVPNGVLYASFKLGSGERLDKDGRWFADMTEESLVELVPGNADLVPLRFWRTNDVRSGEASLCWLNVMLRRDY